MFLNSFKDKSSLTQVAIQYIVLDSHEIFPLLSTNITNTSLNAGLIYCQIPKILWESGGLQSHSDEDIRYIFGTSFVCLIHGSLVFFQINEY